MFAGGSDKATNIEVEDVMRKTVIAFLVLSLCITLMPITVSADATDDCPRVGAYIERVQGLIERASPTILRSGNERAISLLRTAIGEIRTAQRAYEAGMCRVAYNDAQQSEQHVVMALRLAGRHRAD